MIFLCWLLLWLSAAAAAAGAARAPAGAARVAFSYPASGAVVSTGQLTLRFGAVPPFRLPQRARLAFELVGFTSASAQLEPGQLAVTVALPQPGTHFAYVRAQGNASHVGDTLARVHFEVVPSAGMLASVNAAAAAAAADGALDADAAAAAASEAAGGLLAATGRPPLRLVYVGDLGEVDGMKTVRRQQLAWLDRRRFAPEWLDLSCALRTGAPTPFAPVLSALGVPVRSACILVPPELAPGFDAALLALRAARDFHADVPPAWRAVLAAAFEALRGADVLLMSNGGDPRDAYLPELARLAGVARAVQDLGARLEPYPGIRVHAFLAPSGYVKHHAAVAGARPSARVLVVPPGIDAAPASAADCARLPRLAAASPPSPSPPPPPPQQQQQQHERTVAADGSVEPPAPLSAAPPAAVHPCDALPPLGSGRAPTVLFLGRLSSEKSPGVFVRAAAAVVRRWPAAYHAALASLLGPPVPTPQPPPLFVLAGDGALREPLTALAAEELDAAAVAAAIDELSLFGAAAAAGGGAARAPAVRFLGAVPSADRCFHRADVLVFPSAYAETFGIVVGEAAAAGVPVVSFGLGGPADLSVHNVSGLVVQPVGSVAAVADALLQLLLPLALGRPVPSAPDAGGAGTPHPAPPAPEATPAAGVGQRWPAALGRAACEDVARRFSARAASARLHYALERIVLDSA